MYFFLGGGAGNYIPSVDVIWMKKIQRTKIAKTALYFDTGRICHFAWLTVGSPQISWLPIDLYRILSKKPPVFLLNFCPLGVGAF